jgi:hypothetical protein
MAAIGQSAVLAISLKPPAAGDLVAVAHPHVEQGRALGVEVILDVAKQRECGRARAPRRNRTRAWSARSTLPPSCSAMVCMP